MDPLLQLAARDSTAVWDFGLRGLGFRAQVVEWALLAFSLSVC